ncbi:nitrate reductase molybdenum cofactor assembly chaperone [Actinomadura syzygii]|uniref:Nitrate reductase molybdenum cofactor assembly chaperone n=1 Tax=Actinomadura syzygii TaxID=1427538 RepID=A0A5D0UIU6_9ACTN|nr:nitrate reductase molybdenum cofactor assembly chaperone [Actinomadura syzygii]TYC17533.1 nitrate reductase molybdenum cofactor assembly chaperone [Actinomadura syzygii]
MTDRIVYQSASLLLCYPSDDWPETLSLVSRSLAAVRGAAARSLARFCERAAGTGTPLDLGARYVATFDRTRRRTLYLTYYTDGDTRTRGGRLASLKAYYRRHGWVGPDRELPDFLPLMLEFAARDPDAGRPLLADHRPGLDMLRRGLRAYGSDYEHVLDAVCAAVPEGRRR